MENNPKHYHVKSCNSKRGPQYPCDCNYPSIPVKECSKCSGLGDRFCDGRGCQACRDTGEVPNWKVMKKLKKSRPDLQAQLDIAVKALRFYENEEIYKTCWHDDTDAGYPTEAEVISDEGATAKTALKELEGK